MLLADLEITPAFDFDLYPILRDLAVSVAFSLGPWLGLGLGIWLVLWLAYIYFSRLLNWHIYKHRALMINPQATIERFNWLDGTWARERGRLESAGIDEGYLLHQYRTGQIDAASYFQLLRAVRREAFLKQRFELRRAYVRAGVEIPKSLGKLDLVALKEERLLSFYERRQEMIARYSTSSPEPLADWYAVVNNRKWQDLLEEDLNSDLDEVDESEGFDSSSFPRRKFDDFRQYDSSENRWDSWDLWEDPFN